MTEEKDELRIYFEQKLDELEKKDKEDHDSFLGSLMHWGSACLKDGETLYQGIESQIKHLAEKHNATPKELVDKLFAQENYDMRMLVFQV